MAQQSPSVEPVIIDGRRYRAVSEGLAQIVAPYRESTTTAPAQQQVGQSHNNDEGDQAVFYNPIQQYNRDLSVLAILTYGEGALAEKGAKRDDKRKRDKKGRKKAKAEARDLSGTVSADQNGKKRKADVSEEIPVDASQNGKRIKIHQEGEDDDDDPMEIQQLQSDVGSDLVKPSASDVQPTTALGDVPQESTASKSELKPLSFTILDALSASGLRAIRYAKEIPFATNIIANDLSPEAVKSIELNIDHNDLKGKVHSNVGDARAYMYSKVGNEHRNPASGYVHRFDVIDLDPYGSAAPFFDAALLAIADGGLLCVTCTDAGVFASNGYPEKAYALYGGVTMKGAFSHEAGLRLILNAIASSAAKYGLAIEPLLSLSIDFYARLFIRIHKQQQQVKLLAGTTMITYTCDAGCGAWKTQRLAQNSEKLDRAGNTVFKHGYSQAPTSAPNCEHCGSKTHLGGPMWAGPLHNPYFIQRILDKLPDLDKTTYHTTERIRGMLTLALEEDLTLASSNAPATTETEPEATNAPSPKDTKLIPRLPPQVIDTTPFFFLPNAVSRVLHCSTPSEDQLRGAIRYLGYKVTRSHCKAGSFKTNAPWAIIWEIMREWIRQHSPIKEGKITKGMPGYRIMQRIRGTEIKDTIDVRNAMRKALEKGIDGKEELKSLLESGLYRLEHPKVDEGGSNDASKDTSGDHGQLSDTDSHPIKHAISDVEDVSKLKVVFDVQLGKEKPRSKLVRYQINPRANWGPMNRAGG